MGIDVLHALGAPGPVAVVEVELPALEDERADAILGALLATMSNQNGRRLIPYLSYGHFL